MREPKPLNGVFGNEAPLPFYDWPADIVKRLSAQQIDTWERLTALSEAALLMIPGLGAKRFYVLRELVQRAGKSLRATTLREYYGLSPEAKRIEIALPTTKDEPPVPYQQARTGVYFVQCGAFIKIGLSSDVCRRLRGIQGANPHPVAGLGFIPDTWEASAEREFELHCQFREHQHSLEWFHDCEVIRIFITEQAKAWPRP